MAQLKQKPQRTTEIVASAKSSASANGDDDLIQRAINAAATCVDQLGLDKTSVDDIARESGISRATLYRRFGNREAIFSALLAQQARPFVDASIKLTAKAKNLAERIEKGTVYAIHEMPRNRFLKAMFDSGVSRSNLDLIRPVYKQLVDATLLPALESARISGELRAGLDLNEVSEWLLRNFMIFFAEAPWDEDQLLRRLRQFVLPVLIAETTKPAVKIKSRAGAADSVEQRLQGLEQRMTEMQHLLGLVRQDILDQKNPLRRRS